MQFSKLFGNKQGIEEPMKNNSVAIVTGASQGIGRATALRLARDFSAVVLAARNQDELQKTAAAVTLRWR